MAPIFSKYAIYVLCVKMFLNAVTNVISGSCRAPLIAHLARANNFSDCNAKERNQSSVLKLVAIGFGYKFLIYVHGDHRLSFFFFFFLSAAKFACQWKAMSVLQLQTLNPERIEIALQMMEKGQSQKITCKAVSQQESVLSPRSSLAEMGASVSALKIDVSLLNDFVRVHQIAN